ncbi:hypothetical protein JQ626_28115 [Bradyrhizobium diazoefficiens]|jgi:hypothetical protein|nr:hypothetical protein [Bradyrhizobium diazoefficiens]MBR0967934.1 hypothetical protein [Bradyrhizobium diazoefficiens]
MLQSLLSEILEMLLSAAGHAILKALGWDNAFELVAALFGIGCILIGSGLLPTGHAQ